MKAAVQILPNDLRWGGGSPNARRRGGERQLASSAGGPSVSCCATATSPLQVNGED
jgi:hypothetical protein